MSARHAATALLAMGLVVAPAPGAQAQPSIISGINIPFPIVDTTTGCATTGRLRLYPSVDAAGVTTETIAAEVTSTACSVTWSIGVTIIDNALGFAPTVTTGSGHGANTAAATAEQEVTYWTEGSPVPNLVRGPSNVAFRTSWKGSNGVSGCVINEWAVVPFAAAAEVAVSPCDDRVQIID